MVMNGLSDVSDVDVVARLKTLVGEERRLSAAVLAHLAEVDARQLYLPAACSSMYAYCVGVLGMSEDVAVKRIAAARATRRFPVLFDAMSEGRLNTSGVVVLAPHLTEENEDRVVEEASGKRKAEIEVLLARLAPKPDLPARLEREVAQVTLSAPGRIEDEPAAAPARLAPLAPERFALQVTIEGATRDKLMRAQALMRHQVPSGDLAQIIDRALDALLDRVEQRRQGKVMKPRAASAKAAAKAPAKAATRYVPRSVRRQVVARDGEQCSFVGEDGRRCEERGFLELDHVVPVAQGGRAGDGIRVLCRPHNLYEARRMMGRDAVDAGRAVRETEAEIVAGLRRMGVARADALRAVAESRGPGQPIEERMRAALRVLDATYRSRRAGTRCEEAPHAWSCPPEARM